MICLPVYVHVRMSECMYRCASVCMTTLSLHIYIYIRIIRMRICIGISAPICDAHVLYKTLSGMPPHGALVAQETAHLF